MMIKGIYSSSTWRGAQQTRRPLTFTGDHETFINNFVSKKADIIIDEVMKNLSKGSNDLKMFNSGFHRNMKENWALTAKGSAFQSVARNSLDSIEVRYKWYL